MKIVLTRLFPPLPLTNKDFLLKAIGLFSVIFTENHFNIAPDGTFLANRVAVGDEMLTGVAAKNTLLLVVLVQ